VTHGATSSIEHGGVDAAVEVEVDHDGGRGDAPGRRLRELDPPVRRIALALGAAVALPFVLAAVQAWRDGWFPIADDGTMLTVARQVFTAHPPLTGETGSFDKYGVQAFHPGPLVYYVLAPFVKVLGGAAGLLTGAAVVSSLAVVGIGYVALRTSGARAALWAWVVALAMVWSLGGTAYVYRPFKAVSALLVLLVFLHLSAAVASGRSSLLPLWVLAASYPAAASIRYVPPIAVVILATLGVVVVARWQRTGRPHEAGRGGDDEDEEDDGAVAAHTRALLRLTGPERRALLLAGVVVVLCWWAPAYEALTNRGGNLRQLYRGGRAATGATEGLRVALAEMSRALVLDPMMHLADYQARRLPYLLAAGLLAAATLVLVVVGRHRLFRRHWAHVAVAGAALAGMTASLAAAPADEGFGAYQILGAVPVGAFALFAAGLVAAAVVGPRLAARRTAPPWVVPALVVALAVIVAVPGPIDDSREDYPWGFAATKELIDESAPHLQSDSYWNFWLVGGRTTPAIFVGLKAGLEAEGVETGLNARAPGLGDRDGPDERTPAGDVLVMPTALTDPGDGWSVVATYEPPGRDDQAADQAAEELLAFARETRPVPLDALAGGLPRILCPGLAAAPSGFTLEACPAAQEVLAAENPIAELSPAEVALIYLVQFGDITTLPLFDGPEPPAELLERARAGWDDVPLTIWAHPAASEGPDDGADAERDAAADPAA